MKCFYHVDRDAVGTCQTCGKGLCQECAAKYTPVTCEDCHVKIVAQARNEREKKKQDALIDTKEEMIKACVIGVIAGVIFSFLMCRGNKESMGDMFIVFVVLFFLWGFGIPFGWGLISHFIPNVFGRGYSNTVLAIFIMVFKFLIASIIGIPAFIIQMVLMVIKYNKIKKS